MRGVCRLDLLEGGRQLGGVCVAIGQEEGDACQEIDQGLRHLYRRLQKVCLIRFSLYCVLDRQDWAATATRAEARNVVIFTL